MKKILFIIYIIFSFHNLEAKTIDEFTAKKVATNFINRQLKNGKTIDLETNYISTKKDINSVILYTNFYVFNIVDGEGFVIVSADDNIEPILGYSLEKDFEIEKIPSQVSNWLEDYSVQIGIVIEKKISSKLASTKWNNLLANIIIKEKSLPTAVKPLLKTTWNQNPYYNDLCPLDNGVRTVTGCVATAMAQAMKYWNYPATGIGSHSYTAGTYGTQSADFGATTYNWANMPNNVNSTNTEVAELMYHCGVAIEMNYGTAASGGSGAQNTYNSYYSPYPSTHLALIDYFKYDANSIESIYKRNYTDQTWTDKIKSELTEARVVVFEGNSGSGSSGHCFVADGFDINNLIHFNWGWGGYYNGYFSVTRLIPSGTGTGGGAGDYSSSQGAIIGIKPPTTVAPIADFTASSTITNVGSTITLSDLSTNIPSSWTWTITPSTFTYENGTSNNSKFPEVTFTAIGQYTVTLSATNSIGTGSLTKTAYITVQPTLPSQVCKTLTNFSTTDPKVNYWITGGGYMAGHNVSKLEEYAEYYSSYTPYSHISGVVLEFAHAEASNNTNTITVNLYSNNNGSPGAVLTSKSVKLEDIVNDVNNNLPTTVMFDTPYQLTGSFYVGYSLTYNAGDTVSVYTAQSGTIATNTSFFKFPSGNWCAWNKCWTNKQHLKISPMVSKVPKADFVFNCPVAGVPLNFDASSSTNTYDYSWSFSNASIATSNNYNVLNTYPSAGTYNATLTVTGGCGNTNSITKSVNVTELKINASAQTVCSGQPVTLTATGATSYTWDNSVSNGITFNPTATKTYTVTTIDANGCSGTKNITINVNNLPTIAINNSSSTVCSGQPVTLTATGATSYLWDNSVSDGITFNPIATKTYNVTGTDGNGCSSTKSITINVNNLPTIAINSSSTTVCSNQPVTLTAIGATTYVWDNSVSNGITFNPTASKTYNVTGTDANNCSSTKSITINVNNLPTIAVNSSSTTVCSSQPVTLTAIGATTYVWDNSVSNGITFNPTATKNYNVTGTDGNGCSSTKSITINVNNLPTIAINSNSTTVCYGQPITLTATGATTYVWDNSVSNGIIFNPTATKNYNVTGTDGNGCSGTKSITINVNNLPTISINSSTRTVCISQSLTLTAAGANTYIWDNNVTNGVSFNPTASKTYNVTGTDANGCIGTNSISINFSVSNLPTISITNSSTTVCSGQPVTLTASGATTYVWDNSVSNEIAFNPTASKTYTVTGTDANGCSGTKSINITVNQNPTVTIISVPSNICLGQQLTLTGAGAQSYSWNNNVTNALAFTPTLGTVNYIVTGTTNGCTNTANVSVTTHSIPTVIANASTISLCTGQELILTGGGAQTYSWDNNVTNGIAITPSAGVKTFTVTGDNGFGCTNTANVSVTINQSPTVTINSVPSNICLGQQLTLTGGGAQSYSWNNNVTNALVFTPTLGTVNYIVTGTTNGCTNTANVSVTTHSIPTVIANASTISLCTGQELILTGGGAQTYSWDNNVTNGIAITPSAGVKTFTVTGDNGFGCTNTANVSVTINQSPIVTINSVPDHICEGQQLTLTGGGAQTYSWDNNVINGIAITPTVGIKIYKVTGYNGYGCSNTANVSVTVNQNPTITTTAISNNEDQSITLTANGAQSYTWTNGVINAVAFKPSVGAITYTVTGTDANNCTNTANVLVTVLSAVTGLETLNLNGSFNAYFNSTTAQLVINATIDKTSNIIVTLINSAGQEIYNETYINYLGEFNSNINVTTFETGVYILKMDTNQGVISKKLVIN